MREIKFEAYDQDEKRMISFEELTYRNGIMDFLDDYINPFSEITDNDHTTSRIYRQFTGLKDKNGREIYEGDITRYLERNLAKAFGGEVGPDYIVKTKEVIYMDQGFNVPAGFIRDLEVIGNIYEDKNLLEGR